MALVVLGLLSAGFYMTTMDFSPLKLNIYMVHKSLGMTILALVVVRIIWRFLKPAPTPLDTHKTWEKYLSKIIHGLLYFGLIAMPVSGWAMSSAGEFPVNYFGLFDIPALTDKDEALFKLTRTLHEFGAYAIMAAVGLHFLGAAKHHFVDKDATLIRMGGNSLFLIIGALFLISSLVLAVPHVLKRTETMQAINIEEAQANISNTNENVKEQNQWIIDEENTRIEFTFVQYGQPINGSFENVNGTIVFDPDNLEEAKTFIEIDINSIKTGSADRDEQAKSDAWFDSQTHPLATFEAESFSESEDENYTADGFLTIRGQKIPLTLPFTLKISNTDHGTKSAEMRSKLTLMRLDFGVGQGEWADTEAIENAIEIHISVKATQ